MLRVLKIYDDGPEMESAIKEAMEVIDLYPTLFPHLAGQGFKLKKYFSKPHGGVVIENGVVITFERSKSNTKVAKKSIARKKKGDTILHQIASQQSLVVSPIRHQVHIHLYLVETLILLLQQEVLSVVVVLIRHRELIL